MSDHDPQFFSAPPEFLLLAMAYSAMERYMESRIPHYETHEIELPDKATDGGTLIWISQFEAKLLYEFIHNVIGEDAQWPEQLCPLMTELTDMYNNGFTVKSTGSHGDPNLN